MWITRRRALALGTAAGLGALARPGLDVALGADRTASFTLRLPAGTLRGGPTTVLRPRGPFDLLGVSGDALTHAHLEVRTRNVGDAWSRWVPLHPAADHAPDRGGRASTDPVWTGRAQELQLRASRAVGTLTVHFERVARFGGARAAQALATTTVLGSPPFVPRAAWGANQYPPRTDPSYGRVDLAFVHHTETSNDYTADESASIVVAIDNYHRNTNGWNDIGYNFLIDRFGTIFEGRAGGVDKAVIGAQAQGYNSFSTGISCIGSFMSTDLPDAALQALCRLIAWKLPLHGDPVTGALTVVSGGGALNAHPYGAQVTMQRIAGHRDGDSTDCPGDRLYAQLPAIRSRTAALVGEPTTTPSAAPKLTIVAAAASVGYGTQATFRGTLVDGEGTPVAGTGIVVEKLSPSKRWVRVGSARTASDGSWSAAVGWKVAGSVRARAKVAGATVISPIVSVKMTPRLVAGTLTKRAGGVLAVAGTVTPAGPVTLVAQRRSGSGWVTALTRTIRPGGNGVIAASLPAPANGTYRVALASGGAQATTRTVKVTGIRRTGRARGSGGVSAGA